MNPARSFFRIAEHQDVISSAGRHFFRDWRTTLRQFCPLLSLVLE